MNALYEPLPCSKEALGCTHPTPCRMNCLLFNSLVFQPGKKVAGQGYNRISTSPDYSRGGPSEMDWNLGGWLRGMTWPACKQFLVILQVCWHVLLEEKIVLNILIDWHDMCVKALIQITLACK